jgi:hypothetical protein
MLNKLNPNHPVSRALDEELMSKMLAILVQRLGGHVTITKGDIHELSSAFGGSGPALLTHIHTDNIELRVMSGTDGLVIAREAGGLPQ